MCTVLQIVSEIKKFVFAVADFNSRCLAACFEKCCFVIIGNKII
jgi:hypothetical protein